MRALDTQNSTSPQPVIKPAAILSQSQKAAVDIQILIIDDSNQICSLLVSGIISKCAQIKRTANVIQSSALGMLVTIPLTFSDETTGETLTIYTANCPKNALPVIKLTRVQDLTIICDIMTPADTEVGLLGLLREITSRRTRVNLLFVSSEEQNRYYVEELIKRGKAYFVEKGSPAWVELPGALVNRNNLFNYKTIEHSDYDISASVKEQVFKKADVGTEYKQKWWERFIFWKLLKQKNKRF